MKNTVLGWDMEQWNIAAEWGARFGPLPAPTLVGMIELAQRWTERRSDEPARSQITLDHLAPWRSPPTHSGEYRRWVTTAWKNSLVGGASIKVEA